jgi:hypothetical protein
MQRRIVCERSDDNTTGQGVGSRVPTRFSVRDEVLGRGVGYVHGNLEQRIDLARRSIDPILTRRLVLAGPLTGARVRTTDSPLTGSEKPDGKSGWLTSWQTAGG